MTAIILAITSAFSGTEDECDALFPVLMFSIVGLLLSICLVLASGVQPPVGFEVF